MIGTEATTRFIRALVHDMAIVGLTANGETLSEITRSRARRLLDDNHVQQDEHVNQKRLTLRKFNVIALVFVNMV